jgi:large subunit ribosomal protein L6
MKIKKIEETLEIPEGIHITVEGRIVTVKGPKGEVKKEVRYPQIIIKKEDNKLILSSVKVTKNEKKEVNTYAAHIKNMIKGAEYGHLYELKVCSGHFPMNVSVAGGELIIKNFIGEKFPRRLKISPGVTVKVDGDKVTVEHVNKEVAGQTAASIEQLTRRPGFDTRIFQDGIYITKKDGKELA